MVAYGRLTARQFRQLAETIPDRPHCNTLAEYVGTQRDLVVGNDVISIPESHRNLVIGGGNHEASNRLNTRIRQLAAWFSRGEVRFSVKASGPGDVVQAGASLQERFAFRGEQALSRGSMLHKWKQEIHRDLAESGVGILQQHRRAGYYIDVGSTPDKMAEGSKLTDIIWRRRVDPVSFKWEEGPDGNIAIVVLTQTRHLGEIARLAGLEAAQRVLGFFNFGEPLNPDDPDSWDSRYVIDTAEVWGGENGALLVSGGPNPTQRFGPSTQGRILKEWNNPLGKPPFYIAAPGVWPWHSPLDEMSQLTNARNYWATMLDVQASGAIFRHWQLIDDNTGEDITSTLPADAVPESMIYDPSEPPPHMGPGKSWQLAPFEMHEVLGRYQMIIDAHENAGASVARLMGQAVRADTPVGTVDFADEAARQEFTEYTEALEDMYQAAWEDLFHTLRVHHKDPVFVSDKRRDTEGDFLFATTGLPLSGDDVVSEEVEVRLDTRSRLAKIADFRFAVEAITQGFMDFDRAVELGLIPGVDDADAEKAAIFVSEAEKMQANAELRAIFQRAVQAAGMAPEQFAEPDTRFLSGRRTDERGTGTEQGPENISNTGLAPGASDLNRSA